MDIERKIFSRYVPDFEKLLKYGFIRKGKSFRYKKLFRNDEFRADITVCEDGKISGTVFDVVNEDEFLPLKIETQEGGFIGEIRNEYEKILTEIRDKCFKQNLFIHPQANRICEAIQKIYGDMPVFPWESDAGYGVFKNPESGKWYALIMNIDYSKIDKKRSGEIEVVNLKLDENEVTEKLLQKGYFPAWHMNKKKWITLILDDTLSDKTVLDCINKSHKYTVKKSKIQHFTNLHKQI